MCVGVLRSEWEWLHKSDCYDHHAYKLEFQRTVVDCIEDGTKFKDASNII